MKTAAEPVPSTKAPLILLLCAFAVPVLTGFMGTDGSKIHPATLAAWPPECNDRTPDCSTSCLENKYGDLVIERVCRDGDIEPVFGDFSWRYFQRGIFEGARLSGLRYFFRPWLEYEQGNYADRLLYPLNPTPFLITLFLVAAAWIIGVYERRLARQKREDEVTALHI